MRCFGEGDPAYERYHDQEWGYPVTDERGVYERVCLEGFQSGISWAIVLRKRPRFREVFCNFDAERVARFSDADVKRLLADPGIVRNRAKILAAVANARATLALRDGDTPLVSFVWSFRPAPRPAPTSWANVESITTESTGLARELKRRGFKFIGPTTAYALMQACGLVNDHLAACAARRKVEVAQSAVF